MPKTMTDNSLSSQLSPTWAGRDIDRLSERQRQSFFRNGFLVIENVLNQEEIDRYRGLLADFDQNFTHNYSGHGEEPRQPGETLNIRNAVSRATEIRDLMVHPKTFPLLLDVMGPNICLTTSHAYLRPPSPPGTTEDFKQIGWHRDGQAFSTCEPGGQLPWLYTKIGFFFSDTTIPDCGALRAVPGSHRYSGAIAQDDDHWEPYGAVEVGVKAGSAVMFDNRIYHSVGPNYSEVTRENIYLGYCWRYIRPIDYIEQEDHVLEGATPIQAQLLGKVQDALSFYLPQDGDVPLSEFVKQMNQV